jgi:hypothetical protein
VLQRCKGTVKKAGGMKKMFQRVRKMILRAYLVRKIGYFMKEIPVLSLIRQNVVIC